MKKFLFLKLTLIIFLNLLIIISLFGSSEVIYRIYLLGYEKAISSFFTPVQQPSVLGTSDWVIADEDLNYRLNPNKEGINEYSMPDRDIIIPKPAGIKRIIVLGDSIPFEGDPSFVDMLKDKYKDDEKIEILNASTPGYTTYQELIFLEKYLISLEPDVILLTYCLNDNYTFLHRFEADANMLWTEEAKKSLKISSNIDAFINKSYLLSFIKMTYDKNQQEKEAVQKNTFPWENKLDFNIAWKDYSWTDFSNRINKMNNLLKNNNIKLYITIFPLQLQLNPDLITHHNDLVRKPQNKVLSYCDLYNISCLDLFDDFYQKDYLENKHLYTDGVHLTTKGHEVAFEQILKLLENEL